MAFPLIRSNQGLEKKLQHLGSRGREFLETIELESCTGVRRLHMLRYSTEPQADCAKAIS